MTFFDIILVIVGAGLLLTLTLGRCLGLAPYRIGIVMYLANVLLETAEKRTPLSRWTLEAAILVVALLCLGIGSGSLELAALIAVGYLLLVLENVTRERRLINNVYGTQETRGLRGTSPSESADNARRFPAPGLHPQLSVNLDGPFVSRMPTYELGILPVGRPISLSVLIGNHSRTPSQSEIDVTLDVPTGWRVEGELKQELEPLEVGRVENVQWTIWPTASLASQEIVVCVRSSRFKSQLVVRADGCRQIRVNDVAAIEIKRYPEARRATFTWRGDFDLHDTASFQTAGGLETAFGLSMRYAMPQTMYLSTRLSLDQQSADEWARHYHVSRGSRQVPEFVQWLRDNVEWVYDAAYPVRSEKRYVVELGNHGHLHYDTDASGAEGNHWKAGAKPGEGKYPWQGDDLSSFADQRDNITEAARWCRDLLGFEPKSWAKPGRGNDQFSPAAVEAAGCLVATGSDIRPRDNVLKQPPPHHPMGTSIVEITARYPSDPQHIQHAAMLQYWIHRGHRLGIPVVILVHQHMRQFDGVVCERITESLLNSTLNGFHGDFYFNTVFAVGCYWRDVISSHSKVVQIEMSGDSIQIINGGPRPWKAVPVDIRLHDGTRMTRLVDLAPESKITLDI